MTEGTEQRWLMQNEETRRRILQAVREEQRIRDEQDGLSIKDALKRMISLIDAHINHSYPCHFEIASLVRVKYLLEVLRDTSVYEYERTRVKGVL